MIKQNIFFVIFFTIILTNTYAQKPVNQFDNDGKRHGIWTKNYDGTDQVRYKGQFRHGKEIDTFKFYKLANGKSVLSAVKVFNDVDSRAEVKFYTSTGKLVSEGKMDGKNYIGKWVYYHMKSNAVMIEETFNSNGQLDGFRYVYFKNGNIAEQLNYVDGKLSGESKWFSEQKKLIRVSLYNNDELNGDTTYYDTSGNVSSKGKYKDDRKVGLWEYYKNGKLTKKINHTTKEVFPAKQ